MRNDAIIDDNLIKTGSRKYSRLIILRPEHTVEFKGLGSEGHATLNVFSSLIDKLTSFLNNPKVAKY